MAGPRDTGAASVHAFGDDALGDHDATALAALVASGDVSARELALAAIERAKTVNPALNAIVVDCFDDAVGRASSLPRGVFSGVPTFIKDEGDFAGLPTRFGSATLDRARPATKNGVEVEQLVQMGLNVLGKTTLPEFGVICSAEYPDRTATRNPWNLSLTSGGSSAGSAAMVAAGVVPIAHAADGGGSIRIPASCCGLVGLKPSRGRVIEDPALRRMPLRGVTKGVVTRSVRDSWTYLTDAERQFRDPSLPPVGALGRATERTLRIGVFDEGPNGAQIDPPTRAALDETVGALEALGHRVERIANPISSQLGNDFVLYYGTLTMAVKWLGRRLFDPSFDRSLLTPVVSEWASHCRRNLPRVPGALRRLRATSREAVDLFTRHDILLTPTLAKLPTPIGYFDTNLGFEELLERISTWAVFTPWDNASGTPAISLPLGFDSEHNAPIGMMFRAATGHDRLLLELALQLEASHPWRRI